MKQRFTKGWKVTTEEGLVIQRFSSRERAQETSWKLVKERQLYRLPYVEFEGYGKKERTINA